MPSCPVLALNLPMLPASFTLGSDYVQPGVTGFRPNVFTSYWKYLDVDRPVRR